VFVLVTKNMDEAKVERLELLYAVIDFSIYGIVILDRVAGVDGSSAIANVLDHTFVVAIDRDGTSSVGQ